MTTKLTNTERQIWINVYTIHEKHRGDNLDSDNTWRTLAEDCNKMAEDPELKTGPEKLLAKHLAMCMLDYFEALYKQQKAAERGMYQQFSFYDGWVR